MPKGTTRRDYAILAAACIATAGACAVAALAHVVPDGRPFLVACSYLACAGLLCAARARRAEPPQNAAAVLVPAVGYAAAACVAVALPIPLALAAVDAAGAAAPALSTFATMSAVGLIAVATRRLERAMDARPSAQQEPHP